MAHDPRRRRVPAEPTAGECRKEHPMTAGTRAPPTATVAGRRPGHPVPRVVRSEWIKFRSLRSIADPAGRHRGRPGRPRAWPSRPCWPPTPPSARRTERAGRLVLARPARHQPRRGQPRPTADRHARRAAGRRRVRHRHDPRRRWRPCPRRWPVLAAKVAVLGGVVARAAAAPPRCSPSSAARQSSAPTASRSSDDGVLRAVIGIAGYLAGGRGARRGAGRPAAHHRRRASTSLVGAAAGGARVVSLLPATGRTPSRRTCRRTRVRLMSITASSGQLFPAAGLAVFAGWLVVLVGAAIVALRRRDA